VRGAGIGVGRFGGVDGEDLAVVVGVKHELARQASRVVLGARGPPAGPSRDARPGALATLERLEREARYGWR
jgi:hypothetical protein